MTVEQMLDRLAEIGAGLPPAARLQAAVNASFKVNEKLTIERNAALAKAQAWKLIAARFARRARNWRANFRSVGADNAANIKERDRLRAEVHALHRLLRPEKP